MWTDALQNFLQAIVFWVAVGAIFLAILRFLWPAIKRRLNIITPNEVFDGLVELYSELQDIKGQLGLATSEEMEAMQTLEQAGWDLSHRAKVRVVIEEEE